MEEEIFFVALAPLGTRLNRGGNTYTHTNAKAPRCGEPQQHTTLGGQSYRLAFPQSSLVRIGPFSA